MMIISVCCVVQILDPVLFEHMQQNGDYTHFYFCYRWFLLDFKRELKYSQVSLHQTGQVRSGQVVTLLRSDLPQLVHKLQIKVVSLMFTCLP